MVVMRRMVCRLLILPPGVDPPQAASSAMETDRAERFVGRFT
jgi:hypothetical protein